MLYSGTRLNFQAQKNLLPLASMTKVRHGWTVQFVLMKAKFLLMADVSDSTSKGGSWQSYDVLSLDSD